MPASTPRSGTGDDRSTETAGDPSHLAGGRPGAAGPADGRQVTLAELSGTTEQLLTAVRTMSDDDVRAPSRLPGWSRGHVLAHLARSADGLVNLAEWARSGTEREMYAGGRAGRDAEIAADADRSAAEHVADLESSAERLLASLRDLPPEAAQRRLRLASGLELVGGEIIGVRVREVEIHHVDLGAAYTPAHWSPSFAERTLDQLVDFFRVERDVPVTTLHGTTTGRAWTIGTAGPSLSGQESALVAWLTGRSDGDGLMADGDDGVPAPPSWV